MLKLIVAAASIRSYHRYNTYGHIRYTFDVDNDNVGSCILVQDRALGGKAKYARPFEN